MKEIDIQILCEQFADSPARLAWFEANLAGADSSWIQGFLRDVDDSEFPFGQWIDALIVLGQWMDARALKADLEDQVGYVHCASASGGANLVPLSAVLEDMLETYGFERAEKI
jgi:hypothetical protein